MLNSPAVNAFALPTGQLYVTRGLIALANDDFGARLGDVARDGPCDRPPRGDARGRGRQVALVSRIVNDVLSDPEVGALALAKSKIALASFSRAQEFEADGIGVGIAARAGYDPYRGGALPHLDGPQCRAAAIRPANIDPRAPDFLSSHPATPERVKNAQASARQFGAPGSRRARPRRLSRQPSTAWSMARIRAKAWCAAVASCIRGSASPSWRRRASRSTTPRRRCWASRTAAAQRCGSMWCSVPAEQSLIDYLNSGWIENVDRKIDRGAHHQRLPGRDRHRQGRPMVVPALRSPLRQRRLPLHLRDQAHDAGDRPRRFASRVATFRRMSIAESKAAKPLRLQRRHRRQRRHGRAVRQSHGGGRPQARSLPHPQRPRAGRPAQARRSGEDRGGVGRSKRATAL